MNRDDIIRMAREARLNFGLTELPSIERFAALVAAAERERIKQANVAEIEKVKPHISAIAAAAIRARGEK